MLLRVQVYPASLTPLAESGPDVVPTAAVTHFASLASASASSPTQIWSLGRKQGSYNVTSDKSVSREHATISVVSTDSSVLSRNHASAHVPVLTPDRVNASDQMSVVLRNLGKLGSYLVLGGETTNVAKAADHGAGDDSDTADDEEVVKTQQSQAAAAAVLDVTISDVAKHFLSQQGHGRNLLRLQMIGVDEDIVLEALSQIQSGDDGRRRNETAVVQCGKLGTTVVLQRVHIRLVVSSDAKKAVTALEPYFYTTGCTLEENLLTDLDNGDVDIDHAYETVESMLAQRTTITLLVTEKYGARPKHLTAWSRGIPIVTSSFVKELCFDRKSPSDPFPKIDDYAPKLDEHKFWTTKANSKLWLSCTFLSVKNDEYEGLVQSAGANVVPLYKLDSSTDQTTVMDEASIETIIKQEQSTSSCFALDNRLVVTKLIKRLGVPLLTTKQLAQGIVQQELLKDSRGSVIGGYVVPVADVATRVETEPMSERKRKGRNVNSLEDSVVDKSKKKTRPSDKSAIAASQSVADSGLVVDDDSFEALSAKVKEPAKGQGSAKTSKAQKSPQAQELTKPLKAAEATDTVMSAVPQRGNKRAARKGTEKTITSETNEVSSRRSDDDDFNDDTSHREVPTASDGTKMITSTSVDSTTAPSGPQLSESNNKDPMGHPKPTTQSRKRAPKPLDKNARKQGWMSVLPQGTKRMQYRRSNDEIREITGQEKFFEAKTVMCKIQKPSESTTSVPSPTSNDTGPDFKAFRKNTVPMQPLCAVPVRIAVSKDSEYRRNLEKLREENETQQRRVDALFGG